MDQRHLELYNEELHFVREMGKIFAANHPETAGYLDLTSNKCTDPYVERLLEGFAFLTSRIQLKYEQAYPEFTQNILDIIFPDLLAPLPSMTIVQFSPDDQGKLSADGFPVPRQTKLLSPQLRSAKIKCEYRTSHSFHLWPINISDAEYLLPENLPQKIRGSAHKDILKKNKAALKITLCTTNDISLSDLTAMDRLSIYLDTSGGNAGKLHEALTARCQTLLLDHGNGNIASIATRFVEPQGFDEAEAILPTTKQGFEGYRLLQEYYTLPERYMFVSVSGLQPALSQSSEQKVDLYFLFDQLNDTLLETTKANNFKLFCTPAVNLFEKDTDQVHLTKQAHHKAENRRRRKSKEISHYLSGYPIIPENSHPRSYEIYRILKVTASGSYQHDEKEFHPLYSITSNSLDTKKRSFYSLQRHTEVQKKEKRGTRSANNENKYRGNDIYISLSNDNDDNLPYQDNLKELAVTALCTNRGAPLQLPNRISFSTPNDSFPVERDGIKNIHEFTLPKPAHSFSEHTWKLINLLSLNHLSIADPKEPEKSLEALRQLLRLQIHSERVGDSNAHLRSLNTQIDQGLQAIETKNITEAIYIEGRITYARGLEVKVTLEETSFGAHSPFLFGSILDKFFARYASVNSFTQTVIYTLERGEIMRWPIRMGTQNNL